MSIPSISPRVVQRRASNPAVSAWVDASAGTGKTTVLTDRVLRLLLAGAAPERILCLTFTRAAAAEMSNRIVERLGHWAVMGDGDLDHTLADLTGDRPDSALRTRARQLFARIVDAPAGFRIQTIHAFCQSVLRRFPLEAGVPPHFDLLDDRTADEMLGDAQRALMIEAGLHPDRPLGRAFGVIVEHMGEFGFAELMRAVISARRDLTAAFEAFHGVGLLAPEMRRRLGLQPGDDEGTILVAACRDSAFDAPSLRHACEILGAGSATDQKRATGIAAWLAAADRVGEWPEYVGQFLTKLGEPSKTFMKTKAHQAVAHILDPEAERIVAVAEKLKAAITARATEALLVIADALLSRYGAAKRARAVLDYDDLVEETRNLLEREGVAAWVLYKLDGGIEHILVDEAQDTNPEQWRIVQALAEEFFAGEGARANERTLFAVGDEKQSIYSFQGAEPAALDRLRRHFAQRIEAAGKIMENVDLTLSYRSTQPVLSLVDSVFAAPEARDGLLASDGKIVHRPHRVGHGGLVELWPACAPIDDMPDVEAWQLPVEAAEAEEPIVRLAHRLADTIQNWLATGEILASEGRPIAPGDIMILVRRRTRFVGPMVRALKARNVAVAGVDRLALTEPLAVRDLMALGRFLLLPEDDLTLAALLKSPLIGLTEEQLYTVAYKREGSLWTALGAAAEREARSFEPARAWLASLLGEVDYLRPFELFSKVLLQPCPGDAEAGGSGRRALWRRLGPDAIDPLDEFLSAALTYEQRHAPTLEGFMVWLDASEAEVKRELATRGDAVRIVTVHGAKGLEAPIVILPDTMQPPRAWMGPRLLWDEAPNGSVPYWTPKAAFAPRFCGALADSAKRKVDQEYRRLLYVALTRARDRLYVCGWQGRRSPGDGHWHGMIEAGMRAAGALEVEQAGGGAILRIEQPQTAPLPARATAIAVAVQPLLPDWSRQPAPAEPRPTRPLAPSRLESPGGDLDPAMRSPASAQDAKRFRRGRAMHRLLQILPDLSVEDRSRIAERLLAEFAAEERPALLAEALAVIDDPACSAFFGPSSRAEVPIVGRVGTRGVAGQIDRLLVEPDRITIVDFKSGRAPSAESMQAPPAYLAQMAAYRAVIRQIYPGREIRAVLVWTDGPRAVMLDSAALDPFETYLIATPAA